jgi:hypothetical protein
LSSNPTRLEFELDYLGSTHKQTSFEIFKLDSVRFDFIPNGAFFFFFFLFWGGVVHAFELIVGLLNPECWDREKKKKKKKTANNISDEEFLYGIPPTVVEQLRQLTHMVNHV